MKQNYFIPGIYDYIFKTIMTDEEHIDYIHFLICEITGIPKEELKKNFKILSTFLPLEHKSQKRGQVDILYQYGKNNYINIEMNLEYSKTLLIKNNYYHCKLMAEQFFSGKPYYEGKVIQINLNLFKINNNKEINLYKILDTETYICENENFIKYHINLEKIYNSCYNKDNKELTLLERAFLVLMETDVKKLKKWTLHETFLEKVARRIMKMNEEEYCIGMYDKEKVDKIFAEMLRREREENAIKKGMKKGIKKGIQKGIQKGIKKGIEKGIEKGKAEEKNNIAKNMLKNNLEVSFIQKITNLSLNEILKLKDSLYE